MKKLEKKIKKSAASRLQIREKNKKIGDLKLGVNDFSEAILS